MGARALLVDDDVSAANFMARDGRMLALVMDESMTPLSYRVNGL
jgi:predicted ABC-class ATPase